MKKIIQLSFLLVFSLNLIAQEENWNYHPKENQLIERSVLHDMHLKLGKLYCSKYLLDNKIKKGEPYIVKWYEIKDSLCTYTCIHNNFKMEKYSTGKIQLYYFLYEPLQSVRTVHSKWSKKLTNKEKRRLKKEYKK